MKSIAKIILFTIISSMLLCGCSKDNKILCKTCSKSVEILSGFAQGVLDGVEIYSACFYKDTIRTLIHKLKFNHKRTVARVLASILYNYFKKISLD